ncbi:MAG: AbrB/MazE/SpoVT family DNA-binding domain-containing protein [Deltaproteobacteria bacterium]|nr:AbrB/MazE/SpoVT family DNA-binding domain-containing protein [Deltaproteobacteria bacterium]
MGATSKVSVKRKVFPKGQIVIPVALRKKYHIEIGDHVDVIPKANGILIKSMLPKKRGKSLTDSLFGMFGKYAKGKPKLEKADINEATEAGFIRGREK